VAIRPEKLRQSNKLVTFEFADGTQADFQTECDPLTFKSWWTQMRRYIEIMKLMKPLEEAPEARIE